jgi:GrpB-like predicted nucleotidyltransferase (UPF0157 family)
MKLEIVDPLKTWPAEFQVAARQIRQAFGPLALRIDHIGSTSVPGLPAKDVIDIQITVASLEPDTVIKDALRASGLTVLDDVTADHQPPGSRAGAEHWVKRLASRSDVESSDGARGLPKWYVHVRVLGKANQRYALLFRDYLRANAAACVSYALIKRALAHHVPGDFDAYYDVKDPVCDLIMASAERWAVDTGWEMGPGEP